MARKRSRKKKAVLKAPNPMKPIKGVYDDLHPHTRASIYGIIFIGVATVLLLAKWGKAGPAGDFIAMVITAIFGVGYLVLPLILLAAAAILFFSEKRGIVRTVVVGSLISMIACLGFIHVLNPTQGGYLGYILGSLRSPFGSIAAGMLNVIVFLAGALIATNSPLNLRTHFSGLLASWRNSSEEKLSKEELMQPETYTEDPVVSDEEEYEYVEEVEDLEDEIEKPSKKKKKDRVLVAIPADYTAPTVELLKLDSGKATTGDLRGNANIIKRTLESFNIPVEMGEITVGPKVTQYTLKPAEGVKLNKITGLDKDLSLSLAAHPVRIEAPIPGRSLVGIELPNKAAAMVRLGSLLEDPEFMESGPLGVPLGRDVAGKPLFADIAKMPHLLVAGATGSGKSIFVHSILNALLFKNSPATLRLALVDPKRVELTMYKDLPHLALPVVTENKKALAVLRWALQEMEQRYELFAQVGSRDIGSYNGKHPDEILPYVVIVIDEMADLMATFGREVEGYIVRLAQMARATGIHLILATQRPSVEVITGLIKANITNRVGLKVASQIDSRTILDQGGSEKLLGGGDLLFLSPKHSQPLRLQGAFISEDEIAEVTNFIKENNDVVAPVEDGPEDEKEPPNSLDNLDTFLEDEEEDDLLPEAVALVATAGKASASMFQRRLKVGYARAARLLDIMEAKDLIGPGEGAKAREIYEEKIENYLEG